MPPKRKANDVLEKLHDKKQKVNADIEQTGFVDEEMLQQMSKEELVETVRSLQTALLEAKANSSNQKDLPEALWTPEKVKERATKAKDIARKEIKKQMKWQPSCKQGLTKWSYTGVVPHEDVFKKMFAVGAKDKPWKQKKISRGEFIELFGDIEASIRYSTLSITGKDVSVRWDPSENTIRLSGTYGILQDLDI